ISGSNGYSAGPGYDLVTGRGTPIATSVVNDLVPLAAGGTPTSTNVTASAATLNFGQPDTFTATVTDPAGDPTPTGGTVTFLDAGTAIGAAALVNGQATFTTTTLSVGAHAITAS